MEQRRPSLQNSFEHLGTKIGSPEITEAVMERILDIFKRNDLMADLLESEEFLKILEVEKRLKGEVKTGVVMCIDGRLSVLHQLGRAINTKEIAGSLISLNEDKKRITDRRFIAILEQTADEGREVLEIVSAHTSLRDQDHRCGRITKGIKEGEFSGDVEEVALQEAEKRAAAIEDKYNEILQAKGKLPQKKVAMTTMIDTDTMGLILNFGKENQLSTTELTRNLAQKISQALGETVGGFGSMKDSFTNPNFFIDYSKRVLAITQYLMEEETEEIINYLNQNYPDFSDKQRQALLFTICRTIANQYVTGLASEEEFHHPYLEHQENYMVVSPSGKPFGRFDITQQSFGSVPANREEMLDHVKTKLLLLEANQADKPYILFISSPINRTILDQPDVTLIAAEDAARAYFQVLFNDTEIRKRAEQGSLVIIPILIDEENGRILEIGDYSFYLN